MDPCSGGAGGGEQIKSPGGDVRVNRGMAVEEEGEETSARSAVEEVQNSLLTELWGTLVLLAIAKF